MVQPTSASSRSSCFIIGEGSLAVQCAQLLLDHAYLIHGIVSGDLDVQHWAQEHRLTVLPPTGDWGAVMQRQPFDYLFSINNGDVIPHDILTLPKHHAINYHDALLPKYAGMHATSWALMNREATYGITWHVMTEQVDAGAIVVQREVDITLRDTAFTLNAKCYDAALASFGELIDGLARRSLQPVPQNPAERTYFALSKRSATVISWQQDAEDVEALFRALNFGPYPNPLGLLKIATGDAFFILTDLALHHQTIPAAPGTILSIDEAGLTIALRAAAITIKTLFTMDGEPIAIITLTRQYALEAGHVLCDYDPAIARTLMAQHRRLSRYESFWVNRLATHQPFAWPDVHRSLRQGVVEPMAVRSFTMPEGSDRFRHARHGGLDTFLCAVIAVYVARLNQTNCFDLGFISAALGQSIAGLELFFASLVPLRVNLTSTAAFEQVVRTIEAEVALTTQHQTYARDIVARYPAIPHSPHTPVAVAHVDPLNEDPLSTALSADVSLIFYVTNHDSRLIKLAYKPNVWEPDAIERMAGHLQTIIQAVTANSQQPICELPLLTDAERHQILVTWNDSGTDVFSEPCIHHRFEAQAGRTPDAIAIMDVKASLTYREINERANQLAHHLQALGVGPEVPVGLCVERSTEMVVGILGILKSGGAYVPLAPDYPSERLALILEDTCAPVLVTQAKVVPRLPQHAIQTICLDSQSESLARQPGHNPVSQVEPGHLAYVIYTSGSTGQPKGVLIEHGALANHGQVIQHHYELSPHDRVLQFASLNFDVSLEQLLPPLLVGASVVTGELWPPAEFHQKLKAFNLTVIDLPPAYYQQLFDAWIATPSSVMNTALRLMIVGGEAVPAELVALWQQTPLKTVRLLNAYGPTEATITTTLFDAPQVMDADRFQAGLPIGRPIATRTAYILDRHLQPLPIGVPGELHIGGAGLARGYLNRLALTQETFATLDKNAWQTPAPHFSSMNRRLYKTGDLARYLPNGTIEFLGRIDQQVKIRGYRIEPGEIEAILRTHPSIREVIVIAAATGSAWADQQLIAYVVSEFEPFDAGILRDFL